MKDGLLDHHQKRKTGAPQRPRHTIVIKAGEWMGLFAVRSADQKIASVVKNLGRRQNAQLITVFKSVDAGQKADL